MSYDYPAQEQEKLAYALNSTKAFTVRDRIENQLKEIEARKEQLLTFKRLLDANPDTEQILNLSRLIG